MKPKLKITTRDKEETNNLAGLLKKMDQIDYEYADAITDEIYKIQPFFLSVLLGYSYDVTREELDEIMKIYFVIWEYFRSNPNVRKQKVTEEQFNKIQKKNIWMLKYFEGESDENKKLNIYADNIRNLRSKSLLTSVLFRFDNRPILSKMRSDHKGPVLIGIKSFIECFESL